LPDGSRRYEVVVDVGADPATGKRRQSRRRFKSIDEANAFRDETRVDVRKGTHVAREREIVQGVMVAWLESRRNVRATTLSGYRFVLDAVVDAYGGVPVQALTKAHVDNLVTQLLNGERPRQRRPWSPRSVNYMLGALSMVLDDLVRQGRLARNVAALVDRPKEARAEMSTWTATQADQFFRAMKGDRMEVAWLLALYGLRRGEIAGLRWADVDVSGRKLVIRRARVRVDGRAHESLPKTERGHRTLPLTEDLMSALRRLKRQQAADQLAAGAAYDDSGYVIVDGLGVPLSLDMLTSRWAAAVKASGLPRIRLHDGRHTAGSLMHARHVPIADISAWLGHASPAFTMRQYVHSQDEALQNAATVLGDALRGRVTPA
jgi:integrase